MRFDKKINDILVTCRWRWSVPLSDSMCHPESLSTRSFCLCDFLARSLAVSFLFDMTYSLSIRRFLSLNLSLSISLYIAFLFSIYRFHSFPISFLHQIPSLFNPNLKINSSVFSLSISTPGWCFFDTILSKNRRHSSIVTL